MKYLLISFKNRNSLMAFNQLLKSRAISTAIINTPHSVAVSCGLSIKTDINNLNFVINIVQTYQPQGLSGIFIFERLYGHEQIRRLF